jgi:lysophospholipase L1-like esterase
MKKILFLLLMLSVMAFEFPGKKKITIWLIGDSTMSIKETKAYPETGWGMPFVYFWDSTVTVDNRAKNGRSTSSFMKEGLWEPVMKQMQEGDYVFVQFGHNDEVPTKKTYTTEAEFKANLEKYVDDARSKKANPVLLTPVARRKFDEAGKVVGTHDVYAQIVRDVAKEKSVPLIDLDKEGQELLQSFGVENSKLLFNQLKPGEHPNYPEGKEDNTHFNELGARLIAEIVLKDIKKICPGLAERIKNNEK